MPKNSNSEKIELFLAIQKLYLEFELAAKRISKIIISEVFLPVEKKTIKPIDIGGIAGGGNYYF